MVDDGFALRYIDSQFTELRQYIDSRLADVATAFDRDFVMSAIDSFRAELTAMTAAGPAVDAAAELAMTAADTAVEAAAAAIDAAEDANDAAENADDAPFVNPFTQKKSPTRSNSKRVGDKADSNYVPGGGARARPGRNRSIGGGSSEPSTSFPPSVAGASHHASAANARIAAAATVMTRTRAPFTTPNRAAAARSSGTVRRAVRTNR